MSLNNTPKVFYYTIYAPFHGIHIIHELFTNKSTGNSSLVLFSTSDLFEDDEGRGSCVSRVGHKSTKTLLRRQPHDCTCRCRRRRSHTGHPESIEVRVFSPSRRPQSWSEYLPLLDLVIPVSYLSVSTDLVLNPLTEEKKKKDTITGDLVGPLFHWTLPNSPRKTFLR